MIKFFGVCFLVLSVALGGRGGCDALASHVLDLHLTSRQALVRARQTLSPPLRRETALSDGRASGPTLGELVWVVARLPPAHRAALSGPRRSSEGDPQRQSRPQTEPPAIHSPADPLLSRADRGRFCAGPDALVAASAPVLRRLVQAVRQDPRFFSRGYAATRDRVFQLLDGLSGTRRGLSLVHHTVTGLLDMRAADLASPAFAHARRFLPECLARHLGLLALHPRNSPAVRAALSRYVQRFVLAPRDVPASQSEWLRTLVARAADGPLDATSATGRGRRETLLLKACLVHLPALGDALPPRLLQRMLRGLPALAALSAHDRAFLRFLHRVTLPFDRVFRAHDELVVQSYGLLSLFYQETARTGTSQPEELLSAFDGFLDRTAARSELYARLKTLCELARHSGSRDAPVSATFDSLRDLVADMGVGASRQLGISGILDFLEISQPRNTGKKILPESVGTTSPGSELHLPSVAESWQSLQGWLRHQSRDRYSAERGTRDTSPALISA